MRPLPSRRFVVETALPPEEARRRLAEAVEAPVWRHGKRMLPSHTRPFVGAVDGDAFDLERATAQRSGFLPVIVGRVERAEGGARLTGRIRLRVAGLVFLAVWFGGLLAGVAVLGARALAAGRFDPLLLAPSGMMLAGAALVAASFGGEHHAGRGGARRRELRRRGAAGARRAREGGAGHPRHPRVTRRRVRARPRAAPR